MYITDCASTNNTVAISWQADKSQICWYMTRMIDPESGLVWLEMSVVDNSTSATVYAQTLRLPTNFEVAGVLQVSDIRSLNIGNVLTRLGVRSYAHRLPCRST